MSLVPESKIGKVQFFLSKIAPWTTNAVAIGTTVAEITALDAKVTAANDAINAQIALHEAAKNAHFALFAVPPSAPGAAIPRMAARSR